MRSASRNIYARVRHHVRRAAIALRGRAISSALKVSFLKLLEHAVMPEIKLRIARCRHRNKAPSSIYI